MFLQTETLPRTPPQQPPNNLTQTFQTKPPIETTSTKHPIFYAGIFGRPREIYSLVRVPEGRGEDTEERNIPMQVGSFVGVALNFTNLQTYY